MRRSGPIVALTVALVVIVGAALFLIATRLPDRSDDAKARSTAYRAARRAAAMTAPADSSPIPFGWPSNVDTVTMTRTTHEIAMETYFMAEGMDDQNVIVVQLRGRFLVITKIGVQDSGANGVLTVVADPVTGRLLDLGVSANDKTTLITNPTVLFRR